jgi:hypothetical protein
MFSLWTIRAVFGLTPACGGLSGTACILNLVQLSETIFVLFSVFVQLDG